MPIILSPGCGRAIDLPDDEMALPSIPCARCDTVFCPATGQVAPLQVAPVAVLDTERERPRVQRGTLVACGILLSALVLGIVLLVVAVRRNGSSVQRDAREQHEDKGARGKGREAQGALQETQGGLESSGPAPMTTYPPDGGMGFLAGSAFPPFSGLQSAWLFSSG